MRGRHRLHQIDDGRLADPRLGDAANELGQNPQRQPVARVAAETAMLLGTPAHVEGNLIRVSNGLVGVNEACSGIRSLQTSLMIGLLFGELRRRNVIRTS